MIGSLEQPLVQYAKERNLLAETENRFERVIDLSTRAISSTKVAVSWSALRRKLTRIKK